MGKEIIISEVEYQKYLEAIDIDIQKLSDENIFLLLKEKYFDFIHNKLGIRVSGFMVYDIHLNKHILYQNPLIDDNGSFYPQFPYKINKGKYEEIIDLAFLGNRDKDYRNDDNDVPEFHNFFHDKDKIHPINKKIMHEFWDLNSNPKTNQKVISKFHRPTGEILFFLYAWRYLVRLSSKLDLKTSINSFEDFFYTTFSAPKISREDWFIVTTGFDFSDLFEKFLNRLSDKISKLQTPKEIENLKIIKGRTVLAFLEYQQYEYNVVESTEFIDKEWDTLGINPYLPRARLSLHSLLKYAVKMANYSGESNKSTERKKVIRVLKNAIKSINNANYEDIDQEEIHHSLASIFYSFFTVEGKSYENLIAEKLLKTVQFPIFPYFLEIFFDTNIDDSNRSRWHSPKEHLVFPIWYSKSEIIEMDKKQASRYVAYVLLSMEPVWSFTERFACFDNLKIHELNILRIKTLFQVINKTLVENGFYEMVVKKQLQIPATKAAVALVFARNFAHNIGSHVAIRATNRMAKERIAKLYNFKHANNKIDTSKFKEDAIGNWLDYMGEKLDLFEVARNEFLAEYKLPAKNAMLYRDVILPFCENTLLMDNIAHSEGIHYKDTCENKLKIKVVINDAEILAKYPSLKSYNECKKTPICYPYNFPYLVKATDANIDAAFANKKFFDDKGHDASDIEICLTNEHTLYSILENLIRNSAKHNKDKLQSTNLDLIITINIDEDDDDYYRIQISDNISKVSEEQLNKFAKSIAGSLITNDGEIQKESLGIADIKINAHLLKTDAVITNASLSKALTLVYQKGGSKIFEPYKIEEKPSEEKEYNFGYQFKLCKPKKVIWIGKAEDNNLKKKGIICIENQKNFKPEKQTKTEEPLGNYQFAILEFEAVKELTNELIYKNAANKEIDSKASYQWDDFLIKLPHRVLLNYTKKEFEKLNKEDNKAIIDLKNDGRLQLVKQKIALQTETEVDENKDWGFDFLKNCWENWLRKWKIDEDSKGRLVIYFEDESVAEKWKNFGIKNTLIDIDFISSDVSNFDKINDGKKVAIYDHHAEGYNRLASIEKITNTPSEFIKNRSWLQFDKSSSDFIKFFYPSNNKNSNYLFILDAFDAAMTKIIILDERISEMLNNNESNAKNIRKEDGFNAASETKGDYADLANNGNVFFVTHFLGKNIVENKIENFDFHFNKKALLSLMGKRTITLPFEKDSQEGVVALEVDGIIIHRTYLLALFNKYESIEKKEIMYQLYKKFKRVVVVSGGGYPHSIQDFKVHFKPYSSLKNNFIKYPSKVSLTNII